MDVLSEIYAWLSNANNWTGDAGIPQRAAEHVVMSALAVTLGAAMAFPAGLVIGHSRRGEAVAVAMASLGRAVPSFAVLVLMLPLTIELGLGIGFWPTVTALVLLAIPPILTNTYIGIHGVDAATIEASRAMGMTPVQVLARVEVPLALDAIVGGFRIATLQVIATATLAALVGWGGIGRFIVDGFAVRDVGIIGGGAVLVALLAMVVDAAFLLVQRRSSSGGLTSQASVGMWGR